MFVNETTNYHFVFLARFVSHKQELETSGITSKVIKHPFNKTLLVFVDFLTVNGH